MTRKQQELLWGAAIVGAIILLIFLLSGRFSEAAPETLSYSNAKAYCENKGWRLPTSDELKKSGNRGWTSTFAPKTDNLILPDKTQHECILQPGQNAQFCPDSQKLPVYCVK